MAFGFRTGVYLANSGLGIPKNGRGKGAISKPLDMTKTEIRPAEIPKAEKWKAKSEHKNFTNGKGCWGRLARPLR
jgi:hypothetical protein